MSLTLTHSAWDCQDFDSQLSLTEIRMRVAAIKNRWSDAERDVRATEGQARCQRLAELLERQLVADDCEPSDGLGLLEEGWFA